MELALEPAAAAVAYLMLFVGSEIFGLSLERLGLFTIVLIRLVPILRSVLTQYGTIIGTLPSLERLDQYLTETLQTRETKGGSEVFMHLDRGIHFDRVTFTYPISKASALDDLTLTIPAHRMSALVGRPAPASRHWSISCHAYATRSRAASALTTRPSLNSRWIVCGRASPSCRRTRKS